MRTKLKYLLTLPLMALALAACSDKDGEPQAPSSGERVPIELGYSLAGHSRAGEYDTQLAEGTEVGVTVTDATTGDVLCETQYTVADSGILALVEGYDQPYFPLNGNDVVIEAYTGELSHLANTGLLWQICRDQTLAEDYASNDYCYAKVQVVPTKKTVTLPFVHMMSKVEVTLTENEGAESSITGLSILNTSPNFDVEDGVANVRDGSDVIILNASPTEVNEGILVPQTVAAGTDFLKVSLADGGSFTWAPSADLTFQPGYKYSFAVTVSAVGLSVSVTVEDWTSGASDTDITVGMEPLPDPSLRAVDFDTLYWAKDEYVYYGSLDEFNWSDWEGWRLPTTDEYWALITDDHGWDITGSGWVYTKNGQSITIGYNNYLTSTEASAGSYYAVSTNTVADWADMGWTSYNTVTSTDNVAIRLVHDK